MSGRFPHRGLGLSSNLSAADEPNPYRLIDAHPGLFDFVEYSAPLSLEQARAEASLFEEMFRRREELPVLFHPVHLNLWGPELERREALQALAQHAAAVGSPWVGNDIGWWHSGGHAFPGYLYVAPRFDAAGVRSASAHARHVQAALGELPLLIENPAVMARRGSLHVLEFMKAVHEETGCQLLIDLGHLWSHQLTCGLPLTDDTFGAFPWERVVELHIAGGVVTRRGERAFYVDDHTQPIREELFGLLEQLLPRCTGLRALTYEGDGHPREVAVRTLSRLREAISPPKPSAEASRPPAIEVKSGEGALAANVGEEAWRLFDQVHGAAEGEDPEGLGAEADFRAAVVAERLDADWPMTRLLVAGTRDRLRAFLGSNEYRNAWAEPALSKGLSGAFALWARRACLSHDTAPYANAVALETWSQGLHRHREVEPSLVRLPPGVFLGTFPADLTELHFGVRSLRRHLAGRAWASGELEFSALEALGQLAKRAPTRAWNVAVKRTAVKTELLPLGPSLFKLLRAAEAGLAPESLSGWPAADVAEARRRGLLLVP